MKGRGWFNALFSCLQIARGGAWKGRPFKQHIRPIKCAGLIALSTHLRLSDVSKRCPPPLPLPPPSLPSTPPSLPPPPLLNESPISSLTNEVVFDRIRSLIKVNLSAMCQHDLSLWTLLTFIFDVIPILKRCQQVSFKGLSSLSHRQIFHPSR